MRLFLRISAVFLMALSTQAFADASADLTKILGGINSMQADFAQITSDGKGRSQPVQSGKMSVKRPGLFRWEVQKPSQQMVMTSGKFLWVYDPELMQATKQKLDEQVGNTPALLLSGDPRTLDAAFVISEEKGGATEEKVFLLKPHGKDALFETLRVRFNSNKLTRMELVDALGQKTDIRFNNVQVNPALPAAQFEFTPPKGVDVIDQI